MRSDLIRAVVMALVMIGASALAVGVTPRHYMADRFARQSLADIVPVAFGEWQVDRSIVPVPPNPDLQRVLDATYDEILALTYRNPHGQRIMLSLAYGRNQHKGMNTHRPEVCYPAQGFSIVASGVRGSVDFGGQKIPVTRVVASQGHRNEPITYWLLVGDEVTFFGRLQRWTAIRYGLRGIIPDGVLVRVSSIDADDDAAFALQERFITSLLDSVAPSSLPRLLGSRFPRSRRSE